MIRASDDFWPRDPASHTIHIASVAYNTVFLGEFMQPDWDMFHVSIIIPNSFSCSLCSESLLYALTADMLFVSRVFIRWLNTMLQLEQLVVVPYMSGK